MRNSSFVVVMIAGVLLFSIASCDGSNVKQSKTTIPQDAKQFAEADYRYDELASASDSSVSSKIFKPFPVYTDGRSPDNHYIPAGYMGDYSDVKIDTSVFENPHSGTTCIKVTYSNASSQGARWVGLYWQNPANNWGDRKGGFDLTGASKVVFWARGEKGGERIEEFKIGGITGLYPDSDVAGVGPVLLTTEWQKFEIDLTGKDLSYISGGFCFATNLDVNPDGATFYLDDIKYE